MDIRAGVNKRTLRQFCKAKWHAKDSEDGFGLIEVVVAAVILFIFATMLLSANLASLSVSLFAKEHSTATSIMTATIAQAEAAGYNGAPSLHITSPQTVDGISYTVNYSVTSAATSSTTKTSSTSGLYMISVKVSWQNKGTTYYVNGATQIAQ